MTIQGQLRALKAKLLQWKRLSENDSNCMFYCCEFSLNKQQSEERMYDRWVGEIKSIAIAKMNIDQILFTVLFQYENEWIYQTNDIHDIITDFGA